MIYNQWFYIIFSSEWILASTGSSGKRPVPHDKSKRQTPAFSAEVISQADGRSLKSIDRYHQFLINFCTFMP